MARNDRTGKGLVLSWFCSAMLCFGVFGLALLRCALSCLSVFLIFSVALLLRTAQAFMLGVTMSMSP